MTSPTHEKPSERERANLRAEKTEKRGAKRWARRISGTGSRSDNRGGKFFSHHC